MTGLMYVPSERALARIATVNCVAVVGPSAVGKTTLIRQATACRPELRVVINNTSRPRRADESPGVEYRFHTREHMKACAQRGDYVQVAPTVLGDWYATAAEDYTTEGVSLLPVLAEAVSCFRALPFQSLRVIYVLPPDEMTWLRRLARRGMSSDKLSQRLREAEKSLLFAIHDEEIFFVINNNLEVATREFISLVLGNIGASQMRDNRERGRALASDLRDGRVFHVMG